MTRLMLVAAAACAACAAPSAGAPRVAPAARTLVAVLAHPDDETFFSPVLARYARAGVRVYVVIATDGSQGVAPHAGIPAGDGLATIRVGEARCSARELGIQECRSIRAIWPRLAERWAVIVRNSPKQR
jgi:hypothetical protein